MGKEFGCILTFNIDLVVSGRGNTLTSMARLRRIESLGITSARDEPAIVTQKCFFLRTVIGNHSRSCWIGDIDLEDLLNEFSRFTNEVGQRQKTFRSLRA